MKKFKRKIGLFLGRVKKIEKIYKLLIGLNLILFHWSERMHKLHILAPFNGKEDKDKKYYVIRPRGETEGLLSSYFYVLDCLQWAKKCNYIPWVDFENPRCQYYVGRTINNTKNAWEYFFVQPTNMTREEVKKKRNVLLSGWCFSNKYHTKELFEDKLYFEELSKIIKVQPYILEMVEEVWKARFEGKKTLGVFCRGTDYVALKPKGHFVQPSIEDVVDKIRNFLDIYAIEQIYVVTEDYEYYESLKNEFGDLIFSYDDSFVKNYAAGDYVSISFKDDPYKRGLTYLIRVLLLSRCEYEIYGRTNGSEFAELMRVNQCVASYRFDLGVYE